MKRFFTKKSVACIFTIILLFGFFAVNLSYAATATTNSAPSYKLGDIIGNIGKWAAGIALTPVIKAWAAGLGIILGIVSAGMAICAMIFDAAINFSILKISLLFDKASPLNTIWVLMRDLINISFIFILLYIAITKIIGTWGVKAKTTLVNVIISVVFINFSMFITKILIDVGNLFAVEIYKQILSQGKVISTLLLDSSGLVGFLTGSFNLNGQINIIVTMILQIILVSMLLWVFLYGAFILIGRTVMLIYLTITSPIGFVGKTIPFLGEYSGNWWKELVDQILVAPVLMFFLYVTTKLLESNFLSSLTKAKIATESLGAALKVPPIDVTGFFFYIVMIILLLKGMAIVQKFSGKVGEVAVNVGKAALAAGAVAVTGGVALGVGAAGAGAAAAAAGKTGISALTSRLAFSGKELASTGVKFATGKLDKEPGITGMASGIARSTLVGGIKSATGGFVDVDKINKDLEKRSKESEKALMEKAESIGPQKAIDAQKQFKDTRENISKQAEMRLEGQYGKKPSKDDIQSAEKDSTEKKSALETAEQNLNSKAPGTDAWKQASVLRDKANTEFQKADDKLKKMQDYSKKLREEEEKVAAEMGADLGAIEKGIEESSGKIIEGIQKRNEFIKELEEKGSFLTTGIYGKENRDKIIAKMRAQKGKYNADKENFWKNVQKAAKDAGIDTGGEEKGGEKKDDKK